MSRSAGWPRRSHRSSSNKGKEHAAPGASVRSVVRADGGVRAEGVTLYVRGGGALRFDAVEVVVPTDKLSREGILKALVTARGEKNKSPLKTKKNKNLINNNFNNIKLLHPQNLKKSKTTNNFYIKINKKTTQ